MKNKHFLFAALFLAALAFGFVGCENPGDLLNNGDDSSITDNDSTTNNPNQGGDNNGDDSERPIPDISSTLVATGAATDVEYSSVTLWGRLNTDSLPMVGSVTGWGIEYAYNRESVELHKHSETTKVKCNTELQGENADEFSVRCSDLTGGVTIYYSAYAMVDMKYIYGELDSVHLDVKLTASSNKTSYGTVTGSGTYDYESEVTITAIPNSEVFKFVKWSDGNTDNPRTIIVNKDTTYTAIFDFNAKGTGTEADPYNVQALLNMKADGTLPEGTEKAWVEGYIVGSYVFDNDPKFVIGAEPNDQNNVLIADDANSTDTYAVSALNLGNFKTLVNLKDVPANLKKKIKVYGVVEKYCGISGVVNLEKVFIDGTEVEFPGVTDVEVNDNMTPSEANAAATQLQSGAVSSNKAGVIGYVSKIATAYSSQYDNITIYMSDNQDTEETFYVYRMKGGETLKVGDKIKVTGNLTNYKGTSPQMNTGATYELLEAAGGSGEEGGSEGEGEGSGSEGGEAVGTTMGGITNSEIVAVQSQTGTTSGTYIAMTYSSASGNWTANASGNSGNTYIQIRNKNASYIQSPTFSKNVSKVVINFSSNTTAYRTVYAIPSANVASLPAAATYADSEYATNYGSTNATAGGAESLAINFTGETKDFALIAKGGALYIDSIEVYSAE